MESLTNNYTTVAASNEQAFSQHGTLSESSMFKNNIDNNNNNGNGDSAAQKITAVEDSIDSSSATINIDENNLETVEEDPFLLVSLRKTGTPARPKCVNILYLFGIFDLSLVTLYMIYSLIKHNGDLKEYQWGLVILCFIRFITVMCIASSNKIRELRSILAGVCCFSSLYIIFRVNYLIQLKRNLGTMQIIFLILSFALSQIHWIAYVIVTTDSKRRAELLKYNNIYFEEDVNVVNDNNDNINNGGDNNNDNDNNDVDNNETENLTKPQPSYGSIKNVNLN